MATGRLENPQANAKQADFVLVGDVANSKSTGEKLFADAQLVGSKIEANKGENNKGDSGAELAKLSRPFDLGVPNNKMPDLAKEFEKDPEFQKRFDRMAGYERAGGEPSVGMFAPDGLRTDAMRQMMGKYGVERFKQVLEGLDKSTPGKKYFGNELIANTDDSMADFNKKLIKLEHLMKPGQIERMVEVSTKLQADGFNKQLPMSTMQNEKLVKALQENPAEPKAYIEMEKVNGSQYGRWAKETPESKTNLPSQNLESFKKWKEKDDARVNAERKPFIDEIKNNAEDPNKFVNDAMKKNRVLMLGENHDPKSPMRDFGASAMKGLKESGATHLALEMTQKQLDEYNRTGKLSALPEGLQTESYAKMIAEAKKAGLKVVGVDNGTGDVDNTAAQERDNHMARKIDDILKADKNNKVVFWVGAMHGATTKDQGPKSAADLLREKNHSVSTVMEQSRATDMDSLTFYSRGMEKPMGLDFKKMPKTSEEEVTRIGGYRLQYKYKNWDSAIVFPEPPLKGN